VTTTGGREFLADPVGVIVGLVADIEPELDLARLRTVVTGVAGGRAKQRRLARALVQEPAVLVTTHSPALIGVGDLMLGLRAIGAQQVAAPVCAGCGSELTSQRRYGGRSVCATCSVQVQPCAACGRQRAVSSRDRHGRPRCHRCPDRGDADPVEALIQIIIGLDRSLTTEVVAAAIGRVVTAPGAVRRLAWAVADRPELLTGQGVQAPCGSVLRLIDELHTAGAERILRPACPHCQRVVALRQRVDGLWSCKACYARTRCARCVRCGEVERIAARTDEGAPLCPGCVRRDLANLESCHRCGRPRQVAVRAADGKPLCQSCRPRMTAVCAICDRTTRCEISTATGRPWCDACQKWWSACTACGTVAPVWGGTRHAPLCARCVNPDPAAWRRCPACEDTWQLSRTPCARCTLDQRARALLGGPDGTIAPGLMPFHRVLVGVERPDAALRWLANPTVQAILAELGGLTRPLTHDVLDALPASHTLDHLRAALVATGVLPARDERLLRLHRWATDLINARIDADERRILRRYAIWHHLRRLRRRNNGTPITYAQARDTRRRIRAAATYIDWLTGRGLTLTTCTQPDLEQWATNGDATRVDDTGTFIRWATAHREATGLSFPAEAWDGPSGPHDSEQRWADARRLLNDATLPIPDRVAGLLILLYAQKTTTISRLTTGQVEIHEHQVKLRFGTEPIVLPDPVAALVRELVATRRSPALLRDEPGRTPYLFPGRVAGQPITASRLGQRLHRIGIRPGRARSTALFGLATELPAAVLARMLGIHIHVAIEWQHAAAGDWTGYAANVSHRMTTRR
jgi:hypothetical protein